MMSDVLKKESKWKQIDKDTSSNKSTLLDIKQKKFKIRKRVRWGNLLQINGGPDYYVCDLVLLVRAYLVLLVTPYPQEQLDNVCALFGKKLTHSEGVGYLNAFPVFERPKSS